MSSPDSKRKSSTVQCPSSVTYFFLCKILAVTERDLSSWVYDTKALIANILHVKLSSRQYPRRFRQRYN